MAVYDGDSIEVDVDRGFDDTSRLSIRLRDVWAPELSQPGGLDCRNFALGWVDDNGDGSLWPFRLETFRTPRSDVEVATFGRFVGVVQAASGATLNAAMTAYVTERGFGGGTGSPTQI